MAEESKVTFNPEVLLGGCTTCWYGVAGQPWGSGCGWQIGGVICGTGGTGGFLLRRAFSHLPLPMGDLYNVVVTGCWGIVASHGDGSQMKIPGGGGTSPDILPQEVLGVVTPPKEAVIL